VVEPLDTRHDGLAVPTRDGRRFAQCLRCGAWVIAPAPSGAAAVAIESIETVERPRRGRELRQALTMRLIAVDRAVHTVAFAAVAIAALALRWRLTAIRGWADSTIAALNSSRRGQGGASSQGLLAGLLTRLAQIKPHSLAVLALFAGTYAAVSAFEAVGLWLERRWAEYLTALATVGFLPLEIHELVARVTFVRVGAMVINIAILVYLVVAKHLFGVGGPQPREHDEPIAPLPELADLEPAPG